MGFLAPAVPTALPLLVGAGAGAILNKNNPLQGAMLGALGGAALTPAMTALTGIGGLGGAAGASEATMAAMPSTIMGGADAAGMAAGLPSMEALTAQMPGAMTMPGMMAPQGVNSFIQGYNALPVMDRLKAIMPSPGKAARMGAQMIMGQPEQQAAMPPPAPAAGAPAPRMAMGPPPQVGRFITGMPPRRRRPEDEMWG